MCLLYKNKGKMSLNFMKKLVDKNSLIIVEYRQ